jgi:hypothetical protein
LLQSDRGSAVLSFLLNSLLLSTLLAMALPALSVGQLAVALDDIAAGAASTGALADNSSVDLAAMAARQRLGNVGAEIDSTQSGFGSDCVISVQVSDSVPIATLATTFELIGEGQATCENPDAFTN